MPRFYAGELVTGLKEGAFHPQGIMRPVWELRFTPNDIHSLGLWSQDFSEWIRLRPQFGLRESGAFNFWYRFTVLPDDPVIKPKAPRVSRQLEQAGELMALDGEGAVTLCIDPLLFYRKPGGGEWKTNCSLEAADEIFRGARVLGLKAITISVIDYYRKVENRAARFGVEFLYPDFSTEQGRQAAEELVAPLVEISRQTGLKIRTCCEPALSQMFGGDSVFERGACVDGVRLDALYGPGACEKQDRGQRKKQGCLCAMSVDVGRYLEYGTWSHRCYHDCPQCYARR